MSLTKQDIEHVAKLARLDLDETEIKKFTLQLGDILEYVEKLQEVKTGNTMPMLHSLDSGNILRSDKNTPSIDHTQIMKNAPEAQGEFFKVKKVIE
ncbi:MAG: Asp-tRNA(Asn)/Glu-tRNA(Gln) amidotransferase subunit GatC [bacterium]|nr:Asp-tRNA(Asn)/Glu-tRNA(Gln) amidotransferase subunit GatC [bacterium]